MDSIELISARTANIPLKRKAIKDGNGNIAYMGYAQRGASTSSALWTVKKIYYDADGDFSYEEWSEKNQIMDNYLTLTYL